MSRSIDLLIFIALLRQIEGCAVFPALPQRAGKSAANFATS
jgi:hypothetical protein